MISKISSSSETLWLWLKELWYVTLKGLNFYVREVILMWFIHSSIHLLNVHLLITFYESGTALHTDVAETRTVQTLPLRISEFSKTARHLNKNDTAS